MKKSIVSAGVVLLPLLAYAAVSAEWVEFGSGSASGSGISPYGSSNSFPSIAVDPAGLPVIAWSYRGATSDIHVRRFNGSSWVELGSGSAAGAGISKSAVGAEFPSVAVDPLGRPLVAWRNLLDGYAGSVIYVRRFNGISWTEVGAGSASGNGISAASGNVASLSLAVDPSGAPVVAWRDHTGERSQVYVKAFHGTAWIEVTAGSASGAGISDSSGLAIAPQVAVDADSRIVVAWHRLDNGGGRSQVYVRRYNGFAWTEVGAGSATGGGISDSPIGAVYPALAIDASGNPVVAWQEGGGGNSLLYIKRFNGSSWVEVGAGSASGMGISPSGAAAEPALALDAAGRPYISWTAGGSLTRRIHVIRSNGASWEECGAGSATGDGISGTTAVWASRIVVTGALAAVTWMDGSGDTDRIYVRGYALPAEPPPPTPDPAPEETIDGESGASEGCGGAAPGLSAGLSMAWIAALLAGMAVLATSRS